MVRTETLPESDPSAARAFAATLSDGEHVLWAGRPDERRFTRLDRRLVALGVFWTAVSGAGFWGFASQSLSPDYAGVSLAARAALLVFASAPFVAVSVFCLGGHVLLWRRVRRRTAFAVTTQRVLARRPAMRFLGRLVTRELSRSELGEIVVDGLRHGTGTLDVHGARGVDEPLRLDTVAGADALAALLREAGSSGCGRARVAT